MYWPTEPVARIDKFTGKWDDATVGNDEIEQLLEDGRRFRTLAEHSGEVFWLTRGRSRALEYLSPSFEKVWGVPAEQGLDAECWVSTVQPDDLDAALSAFPTALAGERCTVVYRITRPDGVQRWIRDYGFPVFDADGTVVRVGGIAEDITEEEMAKQRVQEASEREMLLTREVRHRAKNLITMIQAAIALTHAQEVVTFKEVLQDRIKGIARAIDLLDAPSGEICLNDIFIAEIAAFADLGDRAEITGPIFRLSQNAAEVLSLAVHELVTNSVKYGALSVTSGRVAAEWRIEGGIVKLTWCETGGPLIVSPPSRKGFGSMLLRSSIERHLGGMAHLEWRKEGLRVEVSLPYERLVEKRD